MSLIKNGQGQLSTEGPAHAHISIISQEDVRVFIDCYVAIWKGLKGILLDEYVFDQIRRASNSNVRDDLLMKISNLTSIILMAEKETETISLA